MTPVDVDEVGDTYAIGIDGSTIVLRFDADDVVVRLRMPAREARRLATLLLAACDIVEGDDVDDVIARARS